MSRITRWFFTLVVVIGIFFVGLELLYWSTVILNFSPPIDMRLSQPVFWNNLYATLKLVIVMFIQGSYMGIILITGILGVIILVFVTRQPDLVSDESIHPAKALIHNTFNYLGKIARIQGLGEVKGLIFGSDTTTPPGNTGPPETPRFWRWILDRVDWPIEDPDPDPWDEMIIE